MNIGDWLAPVASIIVGLLVYLGTRQSNKIKMRESERRHSIRIQELKNRHENDLYDKLQTHNRTLWDRINKLESSQTIKEVEFKAREKELNDRIDSLYARISDFRAHINRLNAQLIEANLIPIPWTES